MLESSLHTPLREEYIWTADDALRHNRNKADTAKPYFFRHEFSVASVPAEATLYLAGPRSVNVWPNGQMARHAESDPSSPLTMHVFAMQVEKSLHTGQNTIAVEATAVTLDAAGHYTLGSNKYLPTYLPEEAV